MWGAHFLFMYVFMYSCMYVYVSLCMYLVMYLFIHLFMPFSYLFPHMGWKRFQQSCCSKGTNIKCNAALASSPYGKKFIMATEKIEPNSTIYVNYADLTDTNVECPGDPFADCEEGSMRHSDELFIFRAPSLLPLPQPRPRQPNPLAPSSACPN